MSSIVDLVYEISGLSLDTAHGSVRLGVVGGRGDELLIAANGPDKVVHRGNIGEVIASVPGFPVDDLAYMCEDYPGKVAWFKVKARRVVK